MTPETVLRAKQDLILCARDDEQTQMRLLKWFNYYITEFGMQYQHSQGDLILMGGDQNRFKSKREDEVIKMHLKLAGHIHESNFSVIESTDTKDGKICDRVLMYLLGRRSSKPFSLVMNEPDEVTNGG